MNTIVPAETVKLYNRYILNLELLERKFENINQNVIYTHYNKNHTRNFSGPKLNSCNFIKGPAEIMCTETNEKGKDEHG